MSFWETSWLGRLFITPYHPQPGLRTFLDRSQTQSSPKAEVTVAVLDARESTQVFGVPLARRGIQPVFVRIANHGQEPLRLQLLAVDPNYYTPLEAACANHFSISKRLTAFGFIGWLFLPLLLLLPTKLITAWLANGKIDDCFRALALRLHPINPGSQAEGFLFTPLDAGTKAVQICLFATGNLKESAGRAMVHPAMGQTEQNPESSPFVARPAAQFAFTVQVPGIAADYLHRNLQVASDNPATECALPELVRQLETMPPTTRNARGDREGDPLNLVVVGDFDRLLSAFAARWDESETITFRTCWKTVQSFLLGSQYRYSPVSPLYLFGRSQDLALQRTRRSINDRLHLRLWLTPLRYQNQAVWLGQVSRDIGVRFTPKTWNLTTHRIDPDVDEARDYVVEDLLQAQRVAAAGYIEGVGAAGPDAAPGSKPRHNLTGDPYFTDGRRVVVLLSSGHHRPNAIAWS